VDQSCDVLVVGAGFSGLAAARQLVAGGATVRVLEAQDRVGGRAETVIDGEGRTLDRGAQAVNRDMGRVHALAMEHRMTASNLHSPGHERIIVDGLDEATANGASAVIAEFVDALRKPDSETKRLLAQLESGASVADLIAALDLEPAERSLAHSVIEEQWGAVPNDLALGYFLDTVARYESASGDWEFQYLEGLGELARRVASGLGERVLLGAVVDRIAWGERDHVVVSSGINCWRTRRLIIALPPTIARRLTFEPILPTAISQALAGWRDGAMIKARFRYERRFWHDMGLSGSVHFATPSGMAIVDATDFDGHFPALTVFLGGRLARTLAIDDEGGRERALTREVERAFGLEARRVVSYVDRVWVDDPFSGGGYNAHLMPSAPADACDLLRTGASPLFFAASEFAPSFPGFVEGAIAAGQAAAMAAAV